MIRERSQHDLTAADEMKPMTGRLPATRTMSTVLESKELDTRSADYFATALRAAVGSVPIVGSLFSELASIVVPNQRTERIAKFLADLDRRLRSTRARGSQRRRTGQARLSGVLQCPFAPERGGCVTDRATGLSCGPTVILGGARAKAEAPTEWERIAVELTRTGLRLFEPWTPPSDSRGDDEQN